MFPSQAGNDSPSSSLFSICPVEIQQQICETIPRTDLKSLRLVSQDINLVAERKLYREIFLKRNTESFCKLRLIATHPLLSKHVQALWYDGRMVQRNPGGGSCFDGWYCFIGDGFTASGESLTRDTIDKFKKSLTEEQLSFHYSKYCEQICSEDRVDKDNIEEIDLTKLFRSCPHLQRIAFYCDPELFGGIQEEVRFEDLSSIGRCTLVEPTPDGGYERNHRQFGALLVAAQRAGIELKEIRGYGLPVNMCRQFEIASPILSGIARKCQSVTLETEFEDRTEANSTKEDYFATMIKHTPLLHTLRRLKLQGIKTTDVDLRRFLTSYQSTLQSLELRHIKFEDYNFEGKVRQGSWVSMILFLHQSLHLQHVCLGGILDNGFKETWDIYDPDEPGWYTTRIFTPWVANFKHRTEQYVLEGGEFPFHPDYGDVRAVLSDSTVLAFADLSILDSDEQDAS